MMRSVLVLVALTTMVASGHADEFEAPDRSEKTAAWRTQWLEPGRSWWCVVGGQCFREREQCESFKLTRQRCKAQAKAWAYSVFEWAENGVLGTWMAYTLETRAECAAYRKGDLRTEWKSSVSPCTPVTRKTGPVPRRPGPWLPPGKGWWCLRGSLDGEEWSSCDRFKVDCERGAEAIASIEKKGTKNARLLAPCTASARAWAFEVKGDEPYYKVRATKADCVADGDPANCKEVD